MWSIFNPLLQAIPVDKCHGADAVAGLKHLSRVVSGPAYSALGRDDGHVYPNFFWLCERIRLRWLVPIRHDSRH